METLAGRSGARSWFLKRRVKIDPKNTNRYLPFLSKYLPVCYDVTIAGGYERGKYNCWFHSRTERTAQNARSGICSEGFEDVRIDAGIWWVRGER